MTEKEEFLKLIDGKKIFIATHWDADGVTSGAMLYHFIKNKAKIIGTNSKGVIFKIDEKDINPDANLIIVSDIIPGESLDYKKTIYIDHHPNEKEYALKIHDDKEQSCSLLIWKKLIYPAVLNYEIDIEETKYFIFLTLLGYFGDGGKEDDLPIDLYVLAKELMPELMKMNSYGTRSFLEIQRYVSLMNIGKRAFWNGNLPLEMMITTTKVEDIVYSRHPLAKKLNDLKREMSKKYNEKVDLIDLDYIDIGVIDSESNIQGVLCARLMNNKPIIIFNRYNDLAIGSMRVPDNIEFDAGKFLNEISNGRINVIEGGGHEKAAGITIYSKDLDEFLDTLKSTKITLA